jgi:hypothetical protein
MKMKEYLDDSISILAYSNEDSMNLKDLGGGALRIEGYRGDSRGDVVMIPTDIFLVFFGFLKNLKKCAMRNIVT